MGIFQELKFLLSQKQKKRALILLFLMFIGMGLETIGVGLVVPVISLMTQSNFSEKYQVIQDLLIYFNHPTQSQIVTGAMVFLVVIYLLKNVFLAFLAWQQSHFIFDVQKEVSQRLFNTYMHQPYVFHLQRNSAQLIRNVTIESSLLTVSINSALVILTESLVILGIAILLLLIEPVGAALVVMILIVAGYTFLKMTRRMILDWGKARQHHEGMRIQHLQQGLGGIKDVILMKRQLNFQQEYQVHNIASATVGGHQSALQQFPRLWLEFLAILGLAVLVIVMLKDAASTNNILPTLGLFAAAAFRLIPSANRMVSAIQSLRYGLPVVNTLYSELKSEPVKVESSILTDDFPGEFRDSIKIENVCFSYPSSNKKTLEKVSFNIKKGESIGFIGASGSGKSTMIDILLGLIQPQFGQVLVDDCDIFKNPRNWQKHIGYVPQSIFLTDDTLRRNVAFGLAENQIDDTAVECAIKMAQMEDFINTLPEGLKTTVGERGIKLSGGQRQRIGIARALYHDPQVLILDEATSALDNATEQEVMLAIRALHGTKTIIIVAHRLSTVAHCDYLYRFNKGRIVDQGRPLDLLNKT